MTSGFISTLFTFKGFTTSTLPPTTTTTTTNTPDLNTTIVAVVNGTNVRLNATQIASPIGLAEKLKPSQVVKKPEPVNLEKKKSNDDSLDFEPIDLATPPPQTPFIGLSSDENLHIANKLTKDKVEQVRKELGIRDEEVW